VSELTDLRSDLLREQIRKTSAEAAIKEIDLAVAEDTERDRQVKLGKIRVLDIFDAIMPKNVYAWIDALEHWSRRDPGGDITININSPGGSVTHGLALYDTIQRLRRNGHRVTVRGSGLVASMASVLLQAGDERVMDKRAKLLIHEGGANMRGEMTAGEMEDAQFFGKVLRDDILDIYVERSNMTKRQIETKWKRRDWLLTADEALKYGFVDRVE
jgi:ATP-dependent Clp endopeptidase proteolytic subunit ClpP